MGYFGKVNLQIKAKKLRSGGISVRQIEKILNVSRSSVSIWTREVILSNQQREKLAGRRIEAGRRGGMTAAINKIRKREQITQDIVLKAKKEVSGLTKRDRFIFGIALYFAEGTKTDTNICFTNSDTKAIYFIKNWIAEFLEVPQNKFRGNLYLHDNINETRAKKYWSALLSIPLSQFGKSYIVKNNPKRLRKTKHEHGVFRLTVCDVNKYRRIAGWISGVFEL